MLERGDHVIVGVSGGADSMCLLQVLLALRDHWDMRLTVVHLDHMLRGDQSRREAEFVGSVAEKLGLPCVIESRDVRALRNTQGLSLQEAARAVRYAFLEDVRKRCVAHRVALGHTADDQAETVLMRLLRGAALPGLAGIPPVRDGVFIRPLIEVRRGEIEAYLASRAIAFIADTSVQEQHYLRNKVRHHLLPLLQREYNPRITDALVRTARVLRNDHQALEALAAREADACLVHEGPAFRCNLMLLRSARPELLPRIVRHMIIRVKGDGRAVAFRHIEAVCRLATADGPSRTVVLPGGLSCRREQDGLLFLRNEAVARSFAYSFDAIPERVEIPEIGRTIMFTIEPKPTDPAHDAADRSDRVLIDYAAATLPLTVRNWRPGDRFMPLGLGGTKKIQDFFTDRKVPRRARAAIPMVLFQNRIAWVCGMQIDDRFKLRPETTTALAMRIV